MIPGLSISVVAVASWPQTRYLDNSPPEPFKIVGITPSTYTETNYTSNAYLPDDFQFSDYDGYPGQGNRGWRNFMPSLPDVRVKAVPFVQFEPVARRRYDFRSAPRWRRGRWKAKS